MRRPSTQLFELIKSLNRAEIVNFRAYASRRKGQKVYMALFDAILEMKEYDEPALKLQFKNQKFVRHLYKTKAYLYKIILESLIGIRQEDEYELYAQIQKIIILILKSLYSHAEELFPHAYKIASEQENFEAYLILLNEERNLIKAKDTSPYLNERLQKIQELENELAFKSRDLMRYTHLLDRANALMRKGAAARKEEIRQLMEDPLMASGREFSFVSEGILYWLVTGKVNQAQGKYELTMAALENAANLYEGHPSLIRESIGFLHYLDVLENLFIANLAARKYQDSLLIGEKIRQLADLGDKGQFLVMERYYYVMLAYTGQTRDLQLGKKIIPEYRSFLERYGGRINRKYQILNAYILGDFYLQTGRPADSLFWLYRIIHEKDDTIRKEIHVIARVLLIIALFDSETSKFVGNSIRSSRDYLRRNGKLGPLEKILFRYFAKLEDAAGDEDKREKVLGEFKKKWMANAHLSGFRWWGEIFDFEDWINQQLENKNRVN